MAKEPTRPAGIVDEQQVAPTGHELRHADVAGLRTVVGTGVAANSVPGASSRDIEAAMAQAIADVARESEAIAVDPALWDTDKALKIAALNAPENMRARIRRARDIATGKLKP